MLDWLVLCRAFHFAAALLAFGVPAFELLVVLPCRRRTGCALDAWPGIARRLLTAAYVTLLLSGIGWFLLAAGRMTGTTPTEIFAGAAQLVWRATHFGLVCKVRLALWVPAALAAGWSQCLPLATRSRGWANRCAALAGGALLASVAWLGHAGADGALTWRVAMDAAHLLTAGLWPAGLLPLLWLLVRRRLATDTAGPAAAGFLVLRSSTVSLSGALLILFTGGAQICFIRDPASLLGTPYGNLLAGKIAAYLLLVSLGAANRFWLMPRLLTHADAHAMRALNWTIAAELLLAALVIGITAVLGMTALGTAP